VAAAAASRSGAALAKTLMKRLFGGKRKSAWRNVWRQARGESHGGGCVGGGSVNRSVGVAAAAAAGVEEMSKRGV